MSNTILVNKVEIEKSTINKFLIQNKKLEAVKFICEKAKISSTTSQYIVELFQDDLIDGFDYEALLGEDEVELQKQQDEKNEAKINPRSKKYLWIFGIVLLAGFLFLKFVVGFNQLGFHLTELKSYLFGNNNSQPAIEAEIAKGNAINGSDTTVVQSVEYLYPVDTNRLEPNVKQAELQVIKKAHFENLKVSKNAPSDEDAQVALTHLTNSKLTDVIIHQKLNIKIGKCYENPKTEGNFNCVSCMILLYNREKKDWQEAPEGENFMKNAYDFYQASEGDFWEAKDLTMRIPFDYQLFKKYEPK